MTLTWKDGLATVFVGAAAALYGFWMTGTEIAGLSSTRAVTGVVLVLGIAGCYTAKSYFEAVYGAGSDPRPPMPYVVLVSTLGGVALVAAIIALIWSSTVALTVLVVCMVALWVAATIRHLVPARHRELTAAGR
jgi:hypothetical protein